jgi:hypothetical protein
MLNCLISDFLVFLVQRGLIHFSLQRATGCFEEFKKILSIRNTQKGKFKSVARENKYLARPRLQHQNIKLLNF